MMEGKQSSPLPQSSDGAQGAQSQQPPRVQAFQEPFLASPLLQNQPVPSEPSRGTISRSRATSNARPVLHQPQPIRDAVDKAFDQSPTNHLDPAFIAQVTEAVVKSLQNANLSQQTPVPAQQAQYPPPPSSESVPQSPMQSSTASLPARYTPPSPQRNRDDIGSYGSDSPEHEPSDSGTSNGFQSGRSDRDGDTPRPAGSESSTWLKRSNASRERDHEPLDQQVRRRESASDSTGTSTPFRRDSQDSVNSNSHVDSPRSRVRPAAVLSPLEEMTTLERIWQPLFDNGVPTMRLGQFLRGLAIHLIDDYEPKSSLVVTPAKMLRFFDEAKVANDIYPWQTLFGGRMTNASISIMYRRLLCQHHLIQVQNHEIPSVPGLTPAGFESFMSCLIQAHPDVEFDRFAKAVMNMPISNADNKSERFPKELSRRLLPALANPLAEQRIIASMAHESQLLQLRNSTAMPPPPAAAPPPQSSFKERERKPYSHSSFSNAVDDDDLVDSTMPTMPLERERKPYFAKEGTGKLFGSDGDQERPNTSQFKPPESSGTPLQRPNRQNSGPTPQPGSYGASGPSDPRSVPQHNRHRTSMGSGAPPGQFQTGSFPKGRRSPPQMNAFARSDPSYIGDIPPSQYVSNLHYPRTPGGFDREQDGYSSRRGPANGNGGSFDEEARGKPIPSRNGPPLAPGGYDSAYSSVSGVPLVTPYPSRPRPATIYDDRRRSMYGSNGAGTDGWGSFANGNSGYPPQQPGYGSTVQH